VSDNILTAADEQISIAAQDTAPMLEEEDNDGDRARDLSPTRPETKR
jgi:hypothetical protein